MKRVIIGTDWWTDCDDAVALRVFARAHLRGDIQILGIVINACMRDSVASLDAYLNAEGLPKLPIAVDRAATDFTGTPGFQSVTRDMAVNYLSNYDAGEPVRMLRHLLAEAEEPVEFAEIGFLQVQAALLQSGPDDISPLTGMELVRHKVSRYNVMAGLWETGREHNFCNNERACKASAYFVQNCPVPMLFLGWEVGSTVISGGLLPDTDILKRIMNAHGSVNGRSSWDPMLAMIVTGDSETDTDYVTVHGRAYVDAETGVNRFVRDENGPHAYVVKKHCDSYYADSINSLIK